MAYPLPYRFRMKRYEFHFRPSVRPLGFQTQNSGPVCIAYEISTYWSGRAAQLSTFNIATVFRHSSNTVENTEKHSSKTQLNPSKTQINTDKHASKKIPLLLLVALAPLRAFSRHVVSLKKLKL
jgi:hypothetical protein